MAKKNITLLIGGNGLIGKGLARILNTKNSHVVSLEGLTSNSRILITSGTDEVIYLAQANNVKSQVISEELFFVNTFLLTRVIREAYEAKVKRFAYCSTGSIYAPARIPHKEEDSLLSDNISPYVATKFASEVLIRAWKPFFQRLVIFRPFFVYGPAQKKDRLIASMFERINKGEEFFLPNKKGLIFNPIHVNDASRFLLHALRFKDGFDIYNIAGCEEITLFDAVKEISRLLGKDLHFVFQDGKENVLLGDISKMLSTGFKHEINIKEGLNDYFRHFQHKR